MNLKPLNNRVVLKVIEPEEKEGALIIPDTARKSTNEALVLAVGEGTYHNGEIKPVNVKEGDKVIFNKQLATEIENEGEKVLIIKDTDILAIIQQ